MVRIQVTERAGEIRIVKDGKLLSEKIGNVPAVFANGQGGLMDIKQHPDYASNGWICLTYSKPGEGKNCWRISVAFVQLSRALTDTCMWQPKHRVCCLS